MKIQLKKQQKYYINSILIAYLLCMIIALIIIRLIVIQL